MRQRTGQVRMAKELRQVGRPSGPCTRALLAYKPSSATGGQWDDVDHPLRTDCLRRSKQSPTCPTAFCDPETVVLEVETEATRGCFPSVSESEEHVYLADAIVGVSSAGATWIWSLLNVWDYNHRDSIWGVRVYARSPGACVRCCEVCNRTRRWMNIAREICSENFSPRVWIFGVVNDAPGGR